MDGTCRFCTDHSSVYYKRVRPRNGYQIYIQANTHEDFLKIQKSPKGLSGLILKLGFKRALEIFTLYMHVVRHFDHVKNLTQLILF